MPDSNDIALRQILSDANAAHLGFYELWAKSQGISIVGVDILAALAYDVIQVINHVFLSDLLSAKPVPESQGEANG